MLDYLMDDLFGRELLNPRQSEDVNDFMRVMAPMIDRIICNLQQAMFTEDPICGQRYSRIASIVGSVQKRHGRVLEIALREALRAADHYRIWSEPCFAVSRAADTLVNVQKQEAFWSAELPYGEAFRTIQIDLGTFNKSDNGIRAYELKRANGLHDAGKIRSMRRDLACTRVLLKDYGRTLGFSAVIADAKIIFYYGQRSIPSPYSLTGAELDDHFDFAVIARIEAANCYYRDQVHKLLEAL